MTDTTNPVTDEGRAIEKSCRDFRSSAPSNLELTHDEAGFRVWLFDYLIGEAETAEEAISEARATAKSWSER